ncbi:MAG: HNH endonuclease [Plesiomonas shigelloides]
MMWKLKKREDLTRQQLIEHFSYDPLTGAMVRIKRYDSYERSFDCNLPITQTNNRGYYWCNVFGKMFLVHRLVWLYMTGEHPEDEIDHINGDRLDNRWSNLRAVSAFDNARNQGERKDNTSGRRGVTRRGSKWIARISHRGVRYTLGTFNTFDEAVRVREQAEHDFAYHPNHASRISWRGR